MLEQSGLYKITVTSNKSRPVEGLMPESLALSINSSWGTPFAPSGGGLYETLLALESAVAVSSISDYMTMSVWTGSSPVQIELPIDFVAEDPGDAKLKVVDPIKSLMKMALPSKLDGQTNPLLGSFLNKVSEFSEGAGATASKIVNGSGLLVPPGPRALKLNEKDSNEEIITVRVGNFCVFTKVIMLSVNPVFKMILDKTGLPMRAQCTIVFRTYMTPSKGDVDVMFPTGR